MLRELLGEQPRQDSGALLQAMNSMKRTLSLLQRQMEQSGDPTFDFRKAEILTRGLSTSLDELEQSAYAAAFFRKKVCANFSEEMTAEEQEDYARYVYFYKNGFIRVFALLDKLGNLLNDFYDMNTSKVKAHYSYFTVLRQFRYLKIHDKLADRLFELKDGFRDPLNRLRKRRNTEVHYMNVEMQDDLWQKQRALYGKIKLEDLDEHLDDLQQGLDMVCRSIAAAFDYTNQQWERRSTGQ
ncbi:Cthe_2314 family HEPN domain-containing protein [Paenibacillus sp. P96]|uniref:Cthe_2314 family HEPN domain-containing protein n=1 Tax=Paenibacillus zeirhizosphaerae TaxID=2987519 RepID=A0ABT9FV88_9BACL|nr:Cthe_2314 family HEPN domain-containing protein [Paenibacillus sp. P96]MDP4098426.1 Cthe_2314 family HEPN domain-containing protein [Paenibacillus sp. P96]